MTASLTVTQISMMKMNFRKFFTAFVIAITATSIFIPALAGAQDSTSTTPRTRPDRQTPVRNEQDGNREDRVRDGAVGQICLRLENYQSTLLKRFEARKTQLQQRSSIKQTNIATRRQQGTDRLSGRREKRTDNLEEHFAKLEERGNTDEQKLAIAEFQRVIRAEVETRRTAVDMAMQEFREAMDELIARRKNETSGAAENLAEAMKNAVANAVAECKTSDNPQSVFEALKQELRQIQEQFKQDKQAIDKIGGEARVLAQTRNEAVRKAVEEFRAAVEAAAQDLKKAFEQNQETGENTD